MARSVGLIRCGLERYVGLVLARIGKTGHVGSAGCGRCRHGKSAWVGRVWLEPSVGNGGVGARQALASRNSRQSPGRTRRPGQYRYLLLTWGWYARP